MVVKPWEVQSSSTKDNPPSSSVGSSAPAKPEKPLQQSNKKKIYRYPFDRIEEGDDYLKIEVIDFIGGGLNNQGPQSLALITTDQTLAREKQVPKETFILPIPEGIGDTNNADWQNSNMGPLTAGLAGAFNKVLGQAAGGNMLGALGMGAQEIAGKISNFGTSAEGARAIQAGAAVAAANAVAGDGNVQTAINRALGATINPNSQLLFNGVSQRNFSFSWDLVPRSKKESDELKAMIRLFKAYMSPIKGAQAQAGAGFFIKSPNVFQLTYMTGQKPHAFLNQFKPMALTGMSLNYTGSGTYATYSDSTPVHMQLTMNMMELTPIFREDYETKYGQEGVGY